MLQNNLTVFNLYLSIWLVPGVLPQLILAMCYFPTFYSDVVLLNRERISSKAIVVAVSLACNAKIRWSDCFVDCRHAFTLNTYFHF